MTLMWSAPALTELALRLTLDLLCVTILVNFVYLRYRPSREFAFTHIMLNVVTFSLTYLMNRGADGHWLWTWALRDLRHSSLPN